VFCLAFIIACIFARLSFWCLFLAWVVLRLGLPRHWRRYIIFALLSAVYAAVCCIFGSNKKSRWCWI